ncbi:MAG: hypothetical protein AVDCRST_MAG96-142, partial [uncultured Segetibacter sp.]
MSKSWNFPNIMNIWLNRNAKVEAERLKLYLAEFPRKDRSDEHQSSIFWPLNVSN